MVNASQTLVFSIQSKRSRSWLLRQLVEQWSNVEIDNLQQKLPTTDFGSIVTVTIELVSLPGVITIMWLQRN